jgi:hypothetical protein
MSEKPIISRNPDNSGFEERPEYRTVLANARRRFVLADLLSRIHPVAVYDLTDRLCGWEADTDGGAEDPRFESVRRDLLDDHLPALVDADLLERVDGRYRLTEQGMAVEAAARGVDVPTFSAPEDPSQR